METIEKVNVRKIKEDIKEMSTEQRLLKNQRKTVHIKGDRTMEPWEATYKHEINREKLRLMFAAYGLMKGKPFSVTENNHPEEGHPLNEFKNEIDKIKEEYYEV